MSAEQPIAYPVRGHTGEEQWRGVPGHPRYQVSSFGRIRSNRAPGRHTDVVRRWRLMRSFRGGQGYLVVGLTCGQREYVHRLVLMAFVGPCPEGMQCRHLDGDRTNNRLSNLCWGTAAENTHDKKQHGTQQRGSRIPWSRLTEADIEEMRRQRLAGVPRAEVARRFGISREYCTKLVLGGYGLWEHVAPADRAAVKVAIGAANRAGRPTRKEREALAAAERRAGRAIRDGEIRRLHQAGYSYPEIAPRFGLTKSSVHLIVRGRPARAAAKVARELG